MANPDLVHDYSPGGHHRNPFWKVPALEVALESATFGSRLAELELTQMVVHAGRLVSFRDRSSGSTLATLLGVGAKA